MDYANPSHPDTLAALAPLLLEPQAQQSATPSTLNLAKPAVSADRLLAILDYHGITLLISESRTLSAELANLINRRRTLAIAGEALRKHALTSLFEGFTSAQLTRCVLFKGGALAYTVYREPWLRPRSDADILIDHSDRHLAHTVLTALGYQKQFAVEGRYVSYQSSYTLRLAGGSHVHIDLHWRINNRQCLARAFSVDELIRNGRRLDVLNNVIVPSPIENLLIACLHRIGHHAAQERLVWLYDIYSLAQRLSKSDWVSLVAKTREKQLCAVVYDGLQTITSLFGRRVPAHVMLELANTKSEPSALLVRRNLPEWRYFLHDLKSMPSVRARLGFVRETLLPAPSYVKQQMGSKSVLVAYIKRLLRGFKRVRKI